MARFAVRFRLSIGHYGLAVTFHLFDRNGGKIREGCFRPASDVADQDNCSTGHERGDLRKVSKPYLCGYYEMPGAARPDGLIASRSGRVADQDTAVIAGATLRAGAGTDIGGAGTDIEGPQVE